MSPVVLAGADQLCSPEYWVFACSPGGAVRRWGGGPAVRGGCRGFVEVRTGGALTAWSVGGWCCGVASGSVRSRRVLGGGVGSVARYRFCPRWTGPRSSRRPGAHRIELPTLRVRAPAASGWGRRRLAPVTWPSVGIGPRRSTPFLGAAVPLAEGGRFRPDRVSPRSTEHRGWPSTSVRGDSMFPGAVLVELAVRAADEA